MICTKNVRKTGAMLTTPPAKSRRRRRLESREIAPRYFAASERRPRAIARYPSKTPAVPIPTGRSRRSRKAFQFSRSQTASTTLARAKSP